MMMIMMRSGRLTHCVLVWLLYVRHGTFAACHNCRFFQLFSFQSSKVSQQKQGGDPMSLDGKKFATQNFRFFFIHFTVGERNEFFSKMDPVALFFFSFEINMCEPHTHIWWSKCMFVSGFSLSLNSLVDENVASPNRKNMNHPIQQFFWRATFGTRFQRKFGLVCLVGYLFYFADFVAYIKMFSLSCFE